MPLPLPDNSFFLVRAWRSIGPRLYLALALAVMLTLLSSGVGVYYFERGGDAGYLLREESYPAAQSSWQVRKARRQAVYPGPGRP